MVILPFAKKSVDVESIKRVKKAYTKGSAAIFGSSFLLLVITGIYMGSYYLGFEKGFFSSNFQTILSLKILALVLMCVITFISVFFVVKLKKPDPFGKYSHLLGLILCIIIVVLAKVMWIV